MVIFITFIVLFTYNPITEANHAILLTTHNNSPEKQTLYENTIKWWLKHGNTEIFVVDSNNVGFPTIESYKLSQFKFDQKKQFPVGGQSLTTYEIYSILKAYQVFQEKLAKYKYIVKVTGKYRLPHLPRMLRRLNKENKDLIVQYRSENKNSYNTEYIGFKNSKMKKILKCIQSKDKDFEEAIYECAKDLNLSTLKFFPLLVPRNFRVRRNNGSTLYFL